MDILTAFGVGDTLMPASWSFWNMAVQCSGTAFLRMTSPWVTAAAMANVPVSMAIGDHRVPDSPELFHTLDLDGAGARPADLRAHRNQNEAKSTTSGSRAAFSMCVMPSARHAAVIRC